MLVIFDLTSCPLRGRFRHQISLALFAYFDFRSSLGYLAAFLYLCSRLGNCMLFLGYLAAFYACMLFLGYLAVFFVLVFSTWGLHSTVRQGILQGQPPFVLSHRESKLVG